tara:strand:- start:9693 stop:9974 length:282 start_codon:yes stop_codon:yes gene_type:complete
VKKIKNFLKKRKMIKVKSESYLERSLSPILSKNGILYYEDRNYETNPLMETLSGSLSPPSLNYSLSIFEIGEEESDISLSDDSSIYFSEPEIK